MIKNKALLSFLVLSVGMGSLATTQAFSTRDPSIGYTYQYTDAEHTRGVGNYIPKDTDDFVINFSDGPTEIGNGKMDIRNTMLHFINGSLYTDGIQGTGSVSGTNLWLLGGFNSQLQDLTFKPGSSTVIQAVKSPSLIAGSLNNQGTINYISQKDINIAVGQADDLTIQNTGNMRLLSGSGQIATRSKNLQNDNLMIVEAPYVVMSDREVHNTKTLAVTGPTNDVNNFALGNPGAIYMVGTPQNDRSIVPSALYDNKGTLIVSMEVVTVNANAVTNSGSMRIGAINGSIVSGVDTNSMNHVYNTGSMQFEGMQQQGQAMSVDGSIYNVTPTTEGVEGGRPPAQATISSTGFGYTQFGSLDRPSVLLNQGLIKVQGLHTITKQPVQTTGTIVALPDAFSMPGNWRNQGTIDVAESHVLMGSATAQQLWNDKTGIVRANASVVEIGNLGGRVILGQQQPLAPSTFTNGGTVLLGVKASSFTDDKQKTYTLDPVVSLFGNVENDGLIRSIGSHLANVGNDNGDISSEFLHSSFGDKVTKEKLTFTNKGTAQFISESFAENKAAKDGEKVAFYAATANEGKLEILAPTVLFGQPVKAADDTAARLLNKGVVFLGTQQVTANGDVENQKDIVLQGREATKSAAESGAVTFTVNGNWTGTAVAPFAASTDPKDFGVATVSAESWAKTKPTYATTADDGAVKAAAGETMALLKALAPSATTPSPANPGPSNPGPNTSNANVVLASLPAGDSVDSVASSPATTSRVFLQSAWSDPNTATWNENTKTLDVQAGATGNKTDKIIITGDVKGYTEIVPYVTDEQGAFTEDGGKIAHRIKGTIGKYDHDVFAYGPVVSVKGDNSTVEHPNSFYGYGVLDDGHVVQLAELPKNATGSVDFTWLDKNVPPPPPKKEEPSKVEPPKGEDKPAVVPPKGEDKPVVVPPKGEDKPVVGPPKGEDKPSDQGDKTKDQGDKAKGQGDQQKDKGDQQKGQGDQQKGQGDQQKDHGDQTKVPGAQQPGAQGNVNRPGIGVVDSPVGLGLRLSSAAYAAALDTLPSWQEREGLNHTDHNAFATGEETDRAGHMWGRFIGNNTWHKGDSQITDAARYRGVQVGYTAGSQSGLYLAYGHGLTKVSDALRQRQDEQTHSLVTSPGEIGQLKGDTYSLALYHHRMVGKHQSYWDTVGQVSWGRTTMTADSIDPKEAPRTIKASSTDVLLSTEWGKTLTAPERHNRSVQVQTQWIAHWQNIGDYKVGDITVQHNSPFTVLGRVGVRLGWGNQAAIPPQFGKATDLRMPNRYLTANLYHNFGESSTMDYGAGHYAAQANDTWYKIALGLNRHTKGLTMIYGELGYSHSIGGGQGYDEGWNLHLGLHHKF